MKVAALLMLFSSIAIFLYPKDSDKSKGVQAALLKCVSYNPPHVPRTRVMNGQSEYIWNSISLIIPNKYIWKVANTDCGGNREREANENWNKNSAQLKILYPEMVEVPDSGFKEIEDKIITLYISNKTDYLPKAGFYQEWIVKDHLGIAKEKELTPISKEYGFSKYVDWRGIEHMYVKRNQNQRIELIIKCRGINNPKHHSCRAYPRYIFDKIAFEYRFSGSQISNLEKLDQDLTDFIGRFITSP